MSGNSFENEPSITSLEIKEEIEDNIDKTLDAEEVRHSRSTTKKDEVTSRTLAYTLAMVLMIFWLASLNISFLTGINYQHHDPAAISETTPYWWAYTNDVLKYLVTFLLVPLFIIVPPVFERKMLRLCVCLGLTGAGLLLLLGQVLTALVWAFLDSKDAVLDRLSVLLLQLVLAFLVAACLFTLASQRLLAWRRGQGGRAADGAGVTSNAAVGKTLATKHTCKLLLVFCTALLNMGGFGLQNCRPQSLLTKEECSEDASLCPHQCQVAFSSMMTLGSLHSMVLITLLLVIQLHHYSCYHVGFFTRQRAADHTSRFISDFPLSPLERELLHEKTVAARLLQATFTVPLYSHKACSCSS